MRGLLRRAMLLLMRSGPGRWVLSALLLAFGALCVALSFGVTGQDTLAFIIGGVFFLALGAFVLIFTILIRARFNSEKAAGTARANQLLAEGKLLPVPALPNPPKSISGEDLLRVEGHARDLDNVPWGANQRIPDNQVRPAFDQTIATVRRIAGDWSRLSEPIRVFAALPSPYCHVGAAEVMFRLSFVSGYRYVPVGLRQGVRFTTRAQLDTPLQADALMIQIKLLAACLAPSWQKLATQTVELSMRVAPNHPRLPNAMMFYHEMRAEYDDALLWADRAIASGPTPEEVFAARSRKASIFERMKRYDEALAVYDACVQEAPSDPWIWHNMSVLLTRLGRYQDALTCNQRALSIMDFGTARSQREIILAKLGGGGANG